MNYSSIKYNKPRFSIQEALDAMKKYEMAFTGHQICNGGRGCVGRSYDINNRECFICERESREACEDSIDWGLFG